MENTNIRKAIILAGGLGERLRPLTNKIPKPLLPIKGKPIIEHAINNLKNHGITDIILSIGYKADQIKKYFGNGSKFGVNISYCIEDKPLGTGGAIKKASKNIKEPFILVWGDNLMNVNFNEMKDVHKKNNAKITMALTPREDVENFGVVRLEGEKIMGFVEKPKKEEAPTNLINAGAFIIEPEALNILPEGKSSIERDCFEKLAEQGVIYAHSHEGYWFPTDTIEKYEKTKKEWMAIFKAYDIRGIYPKELNEDIAYKIGRAYATLLQKENKKLKIAVGRDMRLSSPRLAKALITGITDQGVNVVDIGLSSTPGLYFAVGNYGYDGGINITASHNPKEHNGFKLVRSKAIALTEDTGIKEIENLVIRNEFDEVKEKGSVEEKNNIIRDSIQHDLEYVNLSKIKPFKIVADPANSMGIHHLEELFKHLPCKLIKMNFELDGNFPSHQPDPIQDENLQDLKKKVVEEKADLGIALDGDSDRIFFIDEKGETIPQSILRGLMAQIFLKENLGAKICYDIRPGKVTYDMIKEAGGIPILTRVGHSFIKQVMRKENALFAGESSGHFCLNTKSGFYEVPMIVILKLLELMSTENRPISEIIRPYKKYHHSGEINFEVGDKEGKIKQVEENFKDAKKVLKLDGLSIEYDDFWFNIRPSNTEPLLRLAIEGKTKEIVEQKKQEILKIINQ